MPLITVFSLKMKMRLHKQALFSATGRTRTGDLLITNQLLYQLSHSSKCEAYYPYASHIIHESGNVVKRFFIFRISLS